MITASHTVMNNEWTVQKKIKHVLYNLNLDSSWRGDTSSFQEVHGVDS